MQPLTRSRPRPRFFGTSGPSFALDFVNGTNALDPRVTFTRASSATYFDSAGVLQSAANDVPRFDYNPVTLAAQGLLIEESRTNLCLDSADLAAGDRGSSTGWYAITRATISSNVIAAPDGTTTADKIVADSSNNTHFAANRTTAGSTTNTNPITVSGFFKAAELSFSSILITEGSTYSRNSVVFFDLSAGTATVPTVAGGAASASATITPVGNGWYRCTLTITLGGTDTRVEIRAYPTNSTSTATFTGNSVDGVYAWGFQLEAGAFPTSYIPTTTTALTRAADVASVNTLSPWFNQIEGTFVASASIIGANSTSAGVAFPNGILKTTDATTNATFARVLLFNTSVSPVRYQFAQRDASTIAAAFDNSYDNPVTPGKQYTLAGAYQNSTGGAFSVDGRAVVTNSTPVTPNTATRMLVGVGFNGGIVGAPGSDSMFLNGHLQRITYYNTRLPNAQLQALTAP